MTWFLAYNPSASSAVVSATGRTVDGREFTYADDSDPVVLKALTRGQLVNVPITFDPATATTPPHDFEAIAAAREVVARNGGTWTAPPTPEWTPDWESLVAAVRGLLADGTGGGPSPGLTPSSVIDQIRSAASTGPRWKTVLQGVLETTRPNIAEHWVTMKAGALVEAFLSAYLNEWGALRGTSPFTWGDALVRGIRENGDGITNGYFLHLNDRRTGVSHVDKFGVSWVTGLVHHNGVQAAPVFVREASDPTNPLWPAGSIVVTAPDGTLP